MKFSGTLRGVILLLLLAAVILAGVLLNDSSTKKMVDETVEEIQHVTADSSPTPRATRSPIPIVEEEESPIPSGSITVNEGGVVREHTKVVRVVDGDTIEIEGGQKVRYIGIDTPETVSPGKPVQCYGKEATEKNKQLVEGQEIDMEKDVSEKDSFGRLLRYVYVGTTFVNHYLVEQGFAYAATFPPDVKFQDMFVEAQQEAREGKLGLWNAGCPETI
jgi:endonuclease YncB( thermonuclease family)